MKLTYVIDDGAARLPLAIRSVEGLWDRAADLRSSPGVQLVEMTTQHLSSTSLTLVDELEQYFENDETPSEADPYALKACYHERGVLEDLLRDVRDLGDDLVAFDEIEALFPAGFDRELSFMLAFTAVGYPAFGYARSYKDSEGDEYYGIVVNLAQARPHLESRLGTFSLSLLANMIRYGLFNHEAFLLAYDDYSEDVGRYLSRPVDQLKDRMMKHGIAWYVSYRHDMAEHHDALGLQLHDLDACAAQWNAAVQKARAAEDDLTLLPHLLAPDVEAPDSQHAIHVMGYSAATAIADRYGEQGLREAIVRGADHFLKLYNDLGQHTLAG